MKKNILWILLVFLICFGFFVIYLKVDSLNKINSDYDSSESTVDVVINPDKVILSSWVATRRDRYENNVLVEKERYIISMVIYEETINVCVESGQNCEELSYVESENKLTINGGMLGFAGEFDKLETEKDYIMNLKQFDEKGNGYIYYFEQPVG